MSRVDLEHRDPNELNGHIKAAFEDVLAEPEETHSIDCIWNNGYGCFTNGRNCCYKFLTAICGLCIALCWGCYFGVLACQHIWCVTPCLRVADITCKALQKFYTMGFNCCLGPCCETIGLLFSRITVTNKNG